jgi:hypothetical protein
VTTPETKPSVQYHAASIRPCHRCNETARLMEVSPHGIAVYECPRGHLSLVDVTKFGHKL